MKRTLCLALSVLGVVAAAASGPADGPAAFERLKTLEGTWEAVGKDGKKAVTVFELTANGSVLLERYTNPAMPSGGRDDDGVPSGRSRPGADALLHREEPADASSRALRCCRR